MDQDDSQGNIIRYLGQLVGGEVQLHHVDPGSDVCIEIVNIM